MLEERLIAKNDKVISLDLTEQPQTQTPHNGGDDGQRVGVSEMFISCLD